MKLNIIIVCTGLFTICSILLAGLSLPDDEKIGEAYPQMEERTGETTVEYLSGDSDTIFIHEVVIHPQ